MELEAAARILSPIIWHTVQAHRTNNDPDMQAYLAGLIYHSCRQMERFCAIETSEAAQALATKQEWGDIRTWSWRKGQRIEAKPRTLHFEHMMPVAQMRDAMLEAASVDEVERLLSSSAVVWITKKEDRELTRLGYSSNRPDPTRAYEEAGIRIARR